MASFAVYTKITAQELETLTKETIVGITEWFKKNPKRRICNAGWVYGEDFKVRKNFIKEDVEAMAAKTKTE